MNHIQQNAEDAVRNLLVKLSQNPDFRNYLETYEENSANVNAPLQAERGPSPSNGVIPLRTNHLAPLSNALQSKSLGLR